MEKLANVNESYHALLGDILRYGCEKNTRSGNVISLFDKHIKIDMRQGFPLLTTKKMFYKGCIHELLWFLKGDTNIRYLVENGVHIWDYDAYRYYKSLIAFTKFANRIGFEFKDKCSEFLFDTAQSLKHILDKDAFIGEVLQSNVKSFTVANKIIVHLKNGEKITYKSSDEIDVEREIVYLKGMTLNIDKLDAEIMFYKYGDLGVVYGFQWRNYNGEVDQIENIVKTLKENPDDRRIMCNAWASNQLDRMALPPCHYSFQFYTRILRNEERVEIFKERYPEVSGVTIELMDDLKIPERELSLKWVQRSCDFFLGIPFNICSYGLLLCMMAQCVNMSVGTLGGSLGDCHIYESHMDAVDEQLSRDPLKYGLPKLILNKNIKNIFDFTYEDIKIENYQSYDKISAPLCVG